MNTIFDPIKTDRLVLMVLDETYAESTLDYYLRNIYFLKDWDPTKVEDFYTIDYHRNLLDMELYNIKQGNGYKLWIFKQEEFETKRTIGFVNLNNIVRGVFQSCFLGYKLDKDEVNKGYMTEALTKLISIAFDDLRLHRIEANIMPKNIASLSVVRKLGFYEEGLAKKYLKINGKWEDHIHMVILNEAIE